MELDENEVDPIYGTKIEEGFILGKTKYSIMSLYDWFMVRKCLINPMTNNLLSTVELMNLLDRFKMLGLFPDINYEKLSSHRIVQIMEKHKVYLDELERQRQKLNTLELRLETNEKKLLKARKKEKYEEMIKKIKEKIILQTNFIQNLKAI